MARTPAHRRRKDLLARAILAPRIAPPRHLGELPAPEYVRPVEAIRTDVEEDWPNPVPNPAEDTPVDEPGGPAPTVETAPDETSDALTTHCVRCGHHYEDCDCVLMPDRRPILAGAR